MAVFASEVVAVLCHDNGVNVYPERGHEVKGSEDHVGQLDRDPLRLAGSGLFPSGVRVAHVLTSEGKIAIVRRERTRPVDERAPVSVFLESLGQLGMDQTAFSWTSFAYSLIFIACAPFPGLRSQTLRIYKAIKGRSLNRSFSAPLMLRRRQHILKIEVAPLSFFALD